jgi:hypothetical protein
MGQQSQRINPDRNEEDPSRSPDNAAAICAYLASERSSWLSGRTFGVGGYKVDLYNNPEIIATAESDGPWTLDNLASQVEANFKPVADGLPQTLFAGQIAQAERSSATSSCGALGGTPQLEVPTRAVMQAVLPQ